MPAEARSRVFDTSPRCDLQSQTQQFGVFSDKAQTKPIAGWPFCLQRAKTHPIRARYYWHRSELLEQVFVSAMSAGRLFFKPFNHSTASDRMFALIRVSYCALDTRAGSFLVAALNMRLCRDYLDFAGDSSDRSTFACRSEQYHIL